MSEDQFTKLFKYMQEFRKDVDGRFDQVDKKIDGIQSTLDSFAKQLLELNQEHLMLSRKVDRIEAWVQQIAQETGVKLSFKL